MQRGVVPRLPMSTNLHCWHVGRWGAQWTWQLELTAAIPARLLLSPLVAQSFWLVKVKPAECVAPCVWTQLHGLQVLSFSFRLLWLQPQRLRFLLCTCEVLQAPCAKKMRRSLCFCGVGMASEMKSDSWSFFVCSKFGAEHLAQKPFSSFTSKPSRVVMVATALPRLVPAAPLTVAPACMGKLRPQKQQQQAQSKSHDSRPWKLV